MRYLEYQKVDEETHDEIINELYQMLEDDKINEPPVQEKKKFKISYDMVIGFLFMAAGLYFIRPFWEKGILLLLPFLIFGYGVYKIINHFFTTKK